MAGLFFWKKNHQLLSKTKISENFSSLGYKKPHFFNNTEWEIGVFPKKKYDIANYFTKGENMICGVGTFGYKGLVYNEALPTILHDFENGRLGHTKFWGSFIILILTQNDLFIFRDGSYLTRLYYNVEQNIFSTSFAGLIENSNKTLSFNHDAATELLVTGLITGNETIIKEIFQLVPGYELTYPKVIYSEPVVVGEPSDRGNAIVQQVDLVLNYYDTVLNSWYNFMPDSVIDIGATGGMDSRLSIAAGFKTTSNIELHTLWRKEGMKNSDFRYAKIIAEKTGLILNTKEITPTLEMTDEQLESTFQEAYNLCDGVIRPGNYWDEEYNTEKYRMNVASKANLKLLGFGGEQYRNEERIPLKSNRDIESWINWEMMYHLTGDSFNVLSDKIRIKKKKKKKISQQLGRNNLKLNLYNHKEYVKRIQTPSYRSLKATIENRVGFCVNPFLDVLLSEPAKLAIPFLGRSQSFQLDMMKNISPEITHIPNGYGYNFLNGEPFQNKLASILWQKLPPALKFPLYVEYKKGNKSNYLENLCNCFPLIGELMKHIEDLKLPINLEKLSKTKEKSRLILNLGYFIQKNRHILNCCR